jgi:hypothetical protein
LINQPVKKKFMKGKYITTYVRLACLSHRKRKDIHAELLESINERKQLLLQWRKLLLTWLVPDVYTQLEATITQRNGILERLDKTNCSIIVQIFGIDDREAA